MAFARFWSQEYNIVWKLSERLRINIDEYLEPSPFLRIVRA